MHQRRGERTQLHLALTFPRGGAAAAATATTLLQKASQWKATPQALFNSLLLGLALTTAAAKVWQSVEAKQSGDGPAVTKSASAKSMQVRFLSVFWLLRCSDWLQGPYFYEVYASKIFNGVPASMALVSRLFLTGFASTALFGPLVGRAADEYGRKKATLAFSVIYALGAWSTKSPLLTVLLVGRALSGIGTSLLFSAPESWLVGEAQATDNQDCLGETFGLAYAGDSLVAISAGQMAGWAASQRGPSGPFELSTGFLAAGGLLAAFLWKENKAPSSGADEDKPSIREAVQVIRRDPKIMLVGAVQSLFEAAMYIFVLQWPPAMATAIGQNFGAAAKTPYGSVFSCFMASCLLGSTMFGQLAKKAVSTEASTAVMLAVATAAMTAATWTIRSAGSTNLPCLIASLFCFEACVGMYFPSIGTLRSRYVPDSHRSVIMNLFGIPLNVLVVAVFLSIHKLGLAGALSISSAALGVATLAMTQLWRRTAAPAAATSSA
jgi:MFS family permease